MSCLFFHSAMCADVIQFAGRLSFQEFVSESNKLNKTETFSQLVQICEKIGYKLNKIVYRGYTVTIKLQEMHDRNIENRTNMRLLDEVQAMEQKLKTFKLDKEQARTEKKNELADMKEKHIQEKASLIASHEGEMESKSHSLGLQINKMSQDSAHAIQSEKNKLQEDYMTQLRELGVDLTQYLKTKQPEPCSELIVFQK